MKLEKLFTRIASAISSRKGEKKDRFCSAIITAAGSGTRMGGVSKQLLELEGKSVLSYSLHAFDDSVYVKEIVIAAKQEETELVSELVKKEACHKPVLIVQGGSTRQESVANAFYALSKKSKFVAIHDGARPLLRSEDVDQLFQECFRCNGVSAAYPVADSMKKTDENGYITSDVERKDVWAVQTPQVFFCDIYRVALGIAQKDGLTVTDDNALVTHAGFPVKLVDIHNKNYKITTPEDLEIIRGVLRIRRNEA